MSSLHLTDEEQAMFAGEAGEALALAMRIVTKLAVAMGADRLLPITSAHVDSCLYHGQAGLDFAERLAELGARVTVPTTLNVSSLDLLHPALYRGGDKTRRAARKLMDAYVTMGCRPTWTCAPYQLANRPAFGEHIAWAESNAIVFANSVMGARTDRYGDFIDICAALTGRVPEAGLHLPENRRAEISFDVSALSPDLRRSEVFFPVLGHLIGEIAGTRVPVILGLPAGTTEDQLKALGAAAASSGGIALFHAVGVTPEAPTLEAVVTDGAGIPTFIVTPEQLRVARDTLSTADGSSRLDAVSIGTPHFSLAEFATLVALLEERHVSSQIDFYVSTNRFILDEVRERGWLEICERAGISIVVDTCTYITPIMKPGTETVMTNSAKWAYYAPGNVGVKVVFGSLGECVQSACAGKVVRDESAWR